MARNSSGTHSLPTGNPVVSGASISSTVHNNTTSDFSSEITDSLSRSGKGAMLAPLELANGTVALPALSFDSDTDCGLYRIGANNVGVAVGGTKILDLATTVGVPDGAVGTPGLNFSSDPDCGLYRIGANNVGLAVGGVKVLDATSSLLTAPFNLKLSGSDPTSTTAFTDTLTPMNFAKACGTLQTDGAGNASVASGTGFNIASVAISGGNIRVTLASAMSGTNYTILCTGSGGSQLLVFRTTVVSTTVFDIDAVVLTTAPAITTVNFATSSSNNVCFAVFGAN